MTILAVMVSFLGLFIGLAAMWMASGASRKAEVQHHTFFDSHIKGLKHALSDLSSTVGQLRGDVEKMKQLKSDVSAFEALENQVSALENKVNRSTEALEGLARSQVNAQSG